MPRFALCNWLYYAKDALPLAVKQAFSEATHFERGIVCRGRTNTICWRFNLPEGLKGDKEGDGIGQFKTTRKGFKGNVIVSPLDAVQLSEFLPPSPERIRDTMCVLVLNSGVKPTKQTIEKLHPILVRKTRVKAMIDFLIKNNSHYGMVAGFRGYNEGYLNGLFEGDTDEGLPRMVDIAYLTSDDAIEGATAGYVPDLLARSDIEMGDDPLLMENVGYTVGENTPMAYRTMKYAAVARCLSGKAFLRVEKGGQPIPDFKNPYLLSWLWPHLDPWGIGSFFHTKRSRYISMEEQVAHLLQCSDRTFESDPEFGLVCYNIIRKQAVANTLRFSAPLSRYTGIVKDIMSIDKLKLFQLSEKCRNDPLYSPSSGHEQEISNTLRALGLFAKEVPGSAAQKVSMRNEIRAMINAKGAPTLFITLTPSDRENFVVPLLAGEVESFEDVMRGVDLTDWNRRQMASRRPAACALFFDQTIRNFIDIILGYGKSKPGLYGKCVGYYATVEAQGRGTLHAHMLVWLKGHPSPRKLKMLLAESDAYSRRLLPWLESIMQADFCVPASSGQRPVIPLPQSGRSSLPSGKPHPGRVIGPLLKDHTSEQFWEEFKRHVDELLEAYMIHTHQATCWKYLKKGEKRSPENCRLGITGETRSESKIDLENLEIQLRKTHPHMTYFTDVVIFCLKCNMDVKFIGSSFGASSFMYYVTDYITKAALSMHSGLAALSYAIKKTEAKINLGGKGLYEGEEALRAVTIAVNSMMGQQEMSQQQVMSYLIGGGDHYTSETFHTFNWGEVIRYVKFSWSREKEGGDPNNEANVSITFSPGGITASNQRLDYTRRPLRLEDVGVYDFFARTRKERLSRSNKEDNAQGNTEVLRFASDHLQYTTHGIVLRISPVIPVLLGPHLPSRENESETEFWARDMLTLFKPWREPRDLKGIGETWMEAYMNFESSLSAEQVQIIDNMGVLAEAREDRQNNPYHLRRNRKGALHIPSDDEGEADPPDPSPKDPECPYSLLLDAPIERRNGQDKVDQRVDDLLGAIPAEDWRRCYLTMHEADASSMAQSLGTIELDEEEVRFLRDEQRYMKQQKYNHISRRMGLPGGSTLRAPLRGSRPPAVSVMKWSDHLASDSLAAEGDSLQRSKEWRHVRKIIVEMGLNNNEEQLRAFVLAANAIIQGSSQFLMYVSGMGGTGKSYLIKAIVTLFERLGRAEELLRGAPTGIAAVLIGGSTLHSLIMAGVSGTQRSASLKLADMWRGVEWLIVDEVSMVGAVFLANLSARIKIAKGDDPLRSGKPFGGVNVIFFGDFCQLKPPQQLSLYSHMLATNPSIAEGSSKIGIDALTGVYLWRRVTNVVDLKVNQRQRTDPTFAQVLENVRIRRWRNPIDGVVWSDNRYVDYLRDRQINRVRANSSEELPQFWDAPIVVGHKVLRDALNAKLVRYHAHRQNADVHIYHSKDLVASQNPSESIKGMLWNLPSNRCNDMVGRLPLFVGMRVMVTENVLVDNGVVNGAEGAVCGIRFHSDEEGRRFADGVYVNIQGSKVGLPGHDPDVALISLAAVSVAFEVNENGFRAKSFRRHQIPLLPSYSYTDFKSQGRSLSHCIVDLATARGQGVYVMLSRVKSLEGLLILRWFSPTQIFQRMPNELRNELERLEGLEEGTEERFQQMFPGGIALP